MDIKEILEDETFKNDHELKKLLEDIHTIGVRLRALSFNRFQRVNPFVEGVFDWKEKGSLLFGKEKNITVFDTCTIVGDVEIGENTWIGPYSALDGTGTLRIGKNCSISASVNIVSHDSVKWALSGGKSAYEKEPITIGDNCFIGTGAFISKGVSIGNCCLIGAGAVVTKNIPDNSIAFGVPARIVGSVFVSKDEVFLEYH